MVFQSPSGIERDKKVQMVLAVILIASACAFFVFTRLNSPNIDRVDGTYQNKCCSDIVIRHGQIHYGSSAINMKLMNMKFGLTGYVDGEFTSQGIRSSKEPTAVTFSNSGGKAILSLPIDRQDRTFQMAGGMKGETR